MKSVLLILLSLTATAASGAELDFTGVTYCSSDSGCKCDERCRPGPSGTQYGNQRICSPCRKGKSCNPDPVCHLPLHSGVE